MPSAMERGRLTVAHGPTLSFGRVGPVPPEVVYVHGVGARWQVFGPVMSHVGTDRGQLAVDLRGHGQADRTPNEYRLREFALDLVDLIDQSCDEPPIVAGHSLGGWVVLAAAAERPDLASGLIVMDSALHPVSFDPDVGMREAQGLPLAMRSMARAVREVDPALLEAFGSGDLMAEYDAAAVLSSLDCPLHLIQGEPEAGGVMTDEDVALASSLVEDLDVTRLSGVGHNAHVDVPDIVAGIVIDALDRRRSRPGPESKGTTS